MPSFLTGRTQLDASTEREIMVAVLVTYSCAGYRSGFLTAWTHSGRRSANPPKNRVCNRTPHSLD
jgi:hypothetical protein